MDVAERRTLIEERVIKTGEVSFGELAEAFDVSEMTVRRDIEALQAQGVVRRVSGGAISITGTAFEPSYGLRAGQSAASKDHIGEQIAAGAALMTGTEVRSRVLGTAYPMHSNKALAEAMHANIQQDGTYSVLPRMWGGMTSSSELRAIADVVDKFAIPDVKVTGGQRIDLLGVKKEDLPAVWADLNKAGLISGHAYSKGLRTVKTCVGSTWCRFGTQDSTGLGIKLEKKLWGSWTPHKVKLAVSGCPRNCAEATCKDVGVICVDSGYQIGVAGAAGMDVKETERLADVPTEQEAIDLTIAFVQLYRENAKYLDRPYNWVAKVGLDWVKERVVDDLDSRAALVERFEISQSVYRKDPWAQHVETERSRYAPLADLTLEAAE